MRNIHNVFVCSRFIVFFAKFVVWFCFFSLFCINFDRNVLGIERIRGEVAQLKQLLDQEAERSLPALGAATKLREVEVLCQANEGSNEPFLQQVLEILYKTDDAEEFVTPDDEAIAAD